MPQWIAREYIARRGSAKFKPEHLLVARCPLLGYALDSLKVDGHHIRRAFLRPETQSEVGNDGYDLGANILEKFFREELVQYLTPELSPLGRNIINEFLCGATVNDYVNLIPIKF